MQRRMGSGDRYVGEYLPGKHGPGALIGSGDFPVIILSGAYIMRSIEKDVFANNAAAVSQEVKP